MPEKDHLKAHEYSIEYRKFLAKKLGITLESLNSRINRNMPNWDTEPKVPRPERARRGKKNSPWKYFQLPGSHPRRD